MIANVSEMGLAIIHTEFRFYGPVITIMVMMSAVSYSTPNNISGYGLKERLGEQAERVLCVKLFRMAEKL